jgi:hypothetical protein
MIARRNQSGALIHSTAAKAPTDAEETTKRKIQLRTGAPTTL